jgi:hypothetical protein
MVSFSSSFCPAQFGLQRLPGGGVEAVHGDLDPDLVGVTHVPAGPLEGGVYEGLTGLGFGGGGHGLAPATHRLLTQ